jgi:homoserine dehydrogenase
MSKSIRLGLLGLGTVGQGVYRILSREADRIERRVGARVEITRIAVRDMAKVRGVDVPAGLLTTDSAGLVRSPDVDIVVELIGGSGVARELVLDAIDHGKHVVTANKALLAEHGDEVRAAATLKGVGLAFEASVAGGIPVIKALRESLAANRILSIFGIINGTCNYILTQMRDERRPFDDVLREAQKEGFAEADPAFDIGGIDSAHKLAILVNLAFGVPVRLDQIHTEGIEAIRPEDIEFARELGYTLKLLAIAKAVPNGDALRVEARVHPTLVPDDSPIAKVGGVYNAVQIEGDAVGDLMFYGRGAGEMPTASAVMGDVLDLAGDLAAGRSVADTTRAPASGGIQPIEEVRCLYYLRFTVEDKPGVLSEISGILGRFNISIESVIQKGRASDRTVPLVIKTHRAFERDVRNALVEIDRLDSVAQKGVLIRVEDADSVD